MAPLNLIGKPTPLVDGPVKVTGSAEYVADIRIPGILEGKVLRSPHAHARILNIDVEKARRAPGVYAVITAADTPDQDWGVTDLKDQPILARDKVRYVGEEVAAVAAEDEAVAFEALELISIEYEPLPAVFDPEEAMSEGASLVHDVARNIADRQAVLRGDMEAALQEADVVYEETYSTPLSYQAYMEPIGSVAVPGGNGKFTLYSPLQLIFNSRDLIAGVLGIKPENLRVIQPFVGGGFGGKSNEDPNAFITMVLAMKTNRPMRVINSRAEEFQAARPRVPTRVWLRMSARKDGTFLSKESRVVADNGAYTGLAKGIMHTALYRAENLYRIQNIRSEGFLVYTNKIPTGAFRGFGNPQGTFAQESTIDALAHELGLDPAEMRLKNALQAGDISIHGWRIGSCGLKEAIQSCAQAMDWESKRRHRGNERFRCGIGMACAIHVSGNRLQLDWEG
ncbi:MAG: xanthine dehydrogenase family protein molybdopterin-binding subunit, partial [Nitrospinota bacterium]|nr:xanthine dehydrogenase family protein molybdopterin-binding subunit [Nitrospinota bacterium]